MKIYENAPQYYSQGYSDSNQATNGEQMVMRELLHNGDIVIDAGANSGMWTEYALSQADVYIHAFEPVPSAFEILQSRVNSEKTVLNRCALGSQSGVRTMYIAGPRHLGQQDTNGVLDHKLLVSQVSSLFPMNLSFHDVTSTPYDVQVITLDEYCLSKRIDKISFLKIDTEGAEYDVIQGAKKLTQHRVIHFMQFEYGPSYKATGISLRVVFDHLKTYSIYRILSDSLLHIPVWNDSLENYVFSNYLASEGVI